MNIEQLKKSAKQARRDIVSMIYRSGAGHPGGALSIADIMTYIYQNEINFNQSPRARLVMSKGHAVAIQYALLNQLGFIKDEEMITFRNLNSRLQGHPNIKTVPQLDANTGLLGQGLSIALGMAAAKKLNNDPNKVYAIIGDGEMHEGQIWEALQQAAHMKMDNLVAVIDYNKLSSHDEVNSVCRLEPLADKLRVFGWNVIELTDGNDMEQIVDSFALARHYKGKPIAILAHTIKGKGVSFMENNGDWHSKTPTDAEYKQAMEDLQ
ncbi:transketolase [Gilliamella sp. B2911]|uniref:transketolase n=1 Tax=Gilliamella sp. B2911 TaxID=2817980 RepID=UPI002269A2E0|nr:transketolase [Gilliamella sp. B2911]MCX8663563.1 transketolase [Gilliamella sp. B2911]